MRCINSNPTSNIVTLRAGTHYLELSQLLHAETAALGRADAFLPVAGASSVIGAVSPVKKRINSR